MSNDISEKIAIEDIYQALDPEAKMSSVSQNFEAFLNAIKLLREKLNFLIKAVETSKELQANPDFMRRLNQICNQTPIAKKSFYDSMQLANYSETQLLNMMASITKSEVQIQSLIEVFHSN